MPWVTKQRARRPALERTQANPQLADGRRVRRARPTGGQVGQDVQNANRVIEEYLRAGEASARLFQGAFGTRSGRRPISRTSPQRMGARAASDSMSFWLELHGPLDRRNGAQRRERQATSHAPTQQSVRRGQDGGLRVAVRGRSRTGRQR